MILNELFSGVERASKISWRGLFEQTRRLKGLLLRVPIITTASLSKEIALAVCSFVKQVRYLKRKSGYLFTALYLKQCAVCLQRFYAGSYRKTDSVSVPISLTRSGIPKIIPSVLRKHVRLRSDRGDMLVKIYLSWFGMAKLMIVAVKVTKATFKSIASPNQNIGTVLEVLDEIKTSFKTLQPMYLPFLQRIPLELGMQWEPTWKSTPLSDPYLRRSGLKVDDEVDKVGDKYAKYPNIFINLKHEIAGFIWNVNKIHSIPDGFFSPGILWSKWVYYPFDKNNTMFANKALDYFESSVGPYFSSLLGAYSSVQLATGRLSQVIEGGGKRRLFAICNYVKQRLLFPVHVWAMKVLSLIPTDGTFDQERPLLSLKEKRSNNCYSFDLKSATDRWPLSVIYTLMSMIWGPTLASSIVNSSLGLNTFFVMPPITKRVSEIAFLTGQPLGYYGSWSLFALSHHYIVWLAANRAYPARKTPFRDYALLGDDILITDPVVAQQYTMLLDKLNVTISIPKSIISSSGAIEFAKRFWVKSMQIDLSPISVRALTECRTTVSLCSLATKYRINNISILQRLGGAGYKVRARVRSTQSKRWERLKAAVLKPGKSHLLPLEWWIGRGKPLNPYLKGRMVSFLLKELKPKELQLFPEELVFDGEREILERTVILNWMKQWLKWVSWYYHIAQNPENVSIDKILDVPMCAKSWKRSNEEVKLLKFGLVWKCYDMGAGWDLGETPRFLFDPNTVIRNNLWISGGYNGSDFIMAPLDLPSTVKRCRNIRI